MSAAVALYMWQLNHIKYLDVFLIIFRMMMKAMNYRVQSLTCLLPAIHCIAFFQGLNC